jgi:hypothetical protein
LSLLRDADAMIDSAKALCAREHRTVSPETCARLRDGLTREKARLKSVTKRGRVIERAADSLRRVERSAKDWRWKGTGFSAFAAEIRRSYKRARGAMRQARDRNRSHVFHTWRKRVKTLWYGLRLLEERIPPLKRRLTSLKRLHGSLGEDHNLLVLRRQLFTSPGGSDAVRVREIAKRRQATLRRAALAVGARQFKDRPKDFARTLA